jgi:hypothetical protein
MIGHVVGLAIGAAMALVIHLDASVARVAGSERAAEPTSL